MRYNWFLLSAVLLFLIAVHQTAAATDCTTDSQCWANQTCVAGHCDYICKAKTDCKEAGAYICIYGQCVQICNNNNGDEDCSKGGLRKQICVEGLCTLKCQDNGERCDCGNVRNSMCIFGDCYRRCTLQEDCPSPYACVNSICRPEVNRDSCGSSCDSAKGLQCMTPQSHTTGCYEKCSVSKKDCDLAYSCIPPTGSDDGGCVNKIGLSCSTTDGCGCGQYCDRHGKCMQINRLGAYCTGNKTCGLNEYCERQSDRCLCVRDNYGRCVDEPTRCANDGQCAEIALGSRCDGTYCSCPGMVIGRRCFSTVSTCGKTSDCTRDDNAGAAACRRGFCFNRCDPRTSPCEDGLMCAEQVCSLQCEEDRDCIDSYRCLNGRCVGVCTRYEQCDGTTQVCDKSTCHFSCNSDEECYTDSVCLPSVGCYVKCADDSHCLPIQHCAANVCSTRCHTDTDCSTKHTCQAGSCFLKCSADNECGSNQECAIGLCMGKCYGTGECGVSEVCDYNKCRFICTTDADCFTPTQICVAGICNFPCENDNHCVSGDDCLEREGVRGCIPTCSSDSDTVQEVCNEVQYCNATDSLCYATFLAACGRGSDTCKPYHYCKIPEGSENGMCFPLFKNGRDCSDGTCGMNEVCVKLTNEENDETSSICRCIRHNHGNCLPAPDICPDPESIYEIVCKDGVKGTVCDTEAGIGTTGHCACEEPDHIVLTHKCVPGVECAADSTCTNQGSCRNFHCYDKCGGSDIDCTMTNYVCSYGACTLSCTVDHECDHNQVCLAGKCAFICSKDHTAYCTSNQICDLRSGFCKQACVDSTFCSGSCVGGICTDSCETQEDCSYSDICIDGECVHACIGDHECEEDIHCVAGQCQKFCNIDNVETFYGQCDMGYTCFGGLCSLSCDTNIGCSHLPHAECYRGVCLTHCDDENPDVCGGAICSGGVCLSACATHTQCGSNMVCTEGQCSLLGAACSSNDECLPSQYCESLRSVCVLNTAISCSDGGAECDVIEKRYYCDTATDGTCTSLARDGESCKTESDCGPSEFCNTHSYCECVRMANGRCMESTLCTDDSECSVTNSECDPVRKACACSSGFRSAWSGFCALDINNACSRDLSCATGNLCINGFCYEKCDSTCTVTKAVCAMGACHPACSSTCSGTEDCVNGVCVPMCTASTDTCNCIEGICTLLCTETDSTCPSDMTCSKAACLRTCADNAKCATNQVCTGGKCMCDSSKGMCPLQGETTDGSYTCLSTADCPPGLMHCQKMPQATNTDKGVCTCTPGALRGVNNTCVWNSDTACIRCGACYGSCPKPHMICNSEHRVCMCADGFILDSTKLRCGKTSGAVTGQLCTAHSDCVVGSCNRDLGFCVCAIGFCASAGACVTDSDECNVNGAPYACQTDNTYCINLPCRDTVSEDKLFCQSWPYVTAAVAIGLHDSESMCEQTVDCRDYRPVICDDEICGDIYCQVGKCACDAGSLVYVLKEGVKAGEPTCVAFTCGSFAECSVGEICDGDLHVCVPAAIKFNAVQLAKDNAALLIGLIVGLICLALLIMGAVFAAVKLLKPSDEELERRFWAEEAERLLKEEEELAKQEKELNDLIERTKQEREAKMKELKEKRLREKQEREAAEKKKREEEERLLEEARLEAKRQADLRAAEALAQREAEKKLKEAERKKREEERRKAEEEERRKAAEAEEERQRQIEEARIAREQAEKERREREKKEEEEARLREEAKAQALIDAERERMEKKRREMKAAKDKREAELRARKAKLGKNAKAEKKRLEELRRQAAIDAALAAQQQLEDDEDDAQARSAWTDALEIDQKALKLAFQQKEKEKEKAKNKGKAKSKGSDAGRKPSVP